ncbi:MAG: type VI secretion system baseplate subunit TssE [Chromatiales bacterium]|nr:type VI secretion system baseplate subunit TssE [Chromatiales bacterium]
MADLTLQERLQPSLLDRLTDDEPDTKVEPRDRRVISVAKLRSSVLRDLGWLLNTGNLESTEDLEGYPEVPTSVINFGMPSLAGLTASSTDAAALEEVVRDAIIAFEPRILRKTLKVKVSQQKSAVNPNALSFEIQGELWAQPVPLNLYMRTEVDLETGTFALEESGR